jgi:Cu-processing system ATP-binding protein
MMSAVAASSLGKIYDVRSVLYDLNFTVPEGAMLALLGHNGAGKTTLMKLMLGLIRPSEGGVSVLGTDPAAATPAFRRQLGFLPENVAFYDEMTGLEVLRFLSRLKGGAPSEVPALLERVGLAEAARRRVRTYSKGMRQRLGLAQALIGRPRLLLLDEPTNGLDPVSRVELFAILSELRAGGTTVIVSSHALTELEARTDLVAILRRGRLVAWGDLPALRATAGLPIRVRVATHGRAAEVASGLGEWSLGHVNDRSIELSCDITAKMALLRRIAELGGAVDDVEWQLPTLDDLYLHFGCTQPEETAP